MPGLNEAQVQIKENGFLDIANEEDLLKQVKADVIRDTAPNHQAIQVEGAPVWDELRKDLRDSGHANDRVYTVTSEFYFYLMGVKGMTLKEAVSVVPGHNDYQTHLKDFWKFIHDNPIKRVNVEEGREPVLGEQKEKSLKNWTSMYENCAKKFSEYQLPDIDYSNPAEVGKHAHEIYFLTSILQDYGQEVETFTRVFPYEARKASGEYDKLYSGIHTFAALQGFTDALKKAHFAQNESPVTKNCAAYSRVILKEISPNYRGKKVSEITNRNMFNQVESLTIPQTNMSWANITDPAGLQVTSAESVNQFLRTGDNKPFEDYVKEQFRNDKLYTKVKQNNRAIELGATSFRTFITAQNFGNDLRTSVLDVFLGDPSAEEVVRRIDVQRDGTLYNVLNDAFHPFDLEGLAIPRSKAGVQLMDTIFVDGKRPAEIWGQKYDFVKDDPHKFQALMQLEVLNAIYTGNHQIDCEVMQIRDDYEPKPIRVPLAKSPALIKKGFDLLDRVDSMNRFFAEEHNRRHDADAAVGEEERNHFAASEEYTKMKNALVECYNQSKPTGSLDRLLNAIRIYQKACKDYIDKRNELAQDEQNLQEERGDAFKRAEEEHIAVATNDLLVLSDLERELRTGLREQGLSYGDDDLYEKPGKLFWGGAFRNYAGLKEELEKDITLRSYNPDDFTRENRNKFVHEEEYEWIKGKKVVDPKTGKVKTVSQWYQPIGKEKYEFLTKDLALDFSDKIFDHFNALGKTLNPKVETINKDGKKVTVNENTAYFDSLGTSAQRPDTMMSVYCLWLMGAKGYSFEQVAQMVAPPAVGADGKIRNQKMIDLMESHKSEYIQFIKDHPLTDKTLYKGQPYEVKVETKKTKEGYAQDVKAWTDVFSNATNKMKEYRVPDIDYSDKDQVRSKESEVMLMRELSINFGQEVPKFFSHDHPVKPTMEFASDAMGGEGNYHKMIQDWIGFQSLTFAVGFGYFVPSKVKETDDLGKAASDATKIAGYRLAANEELSRYKGKSFGEAIEDIQGQGLGLMDTTSEIVAPASLTGETLFDPKPAFGFLSGRERTSFEKTVGNEYRQKISRFAQTVEKRLHGTAAQMLNFEFVSVGKWLNDAMRQLGDDPNEMLQLMKQNGGKSKVNGVYQDVDGNGTVRHIIRNRLLSVVGSDYKGILGLKGMELKDLFLIDGQTPEQKWGAKYNAVPDEDKKTCYLGEICKSLLTANAKVEMRMYSIAPDGKLTETQPATAVEKADVLNRLADNAQEVRFTIDELKRELKELQKDFDNTQDSRESNRYFEPDEEGVRKREGTNLYQDMTVKLDRCIRDLEDDSQTTQKQLISHLKQLKEAADTYYQARYGHFFRPIHDKGKIRLTTSNRTKKIAARFADRIYGLQSRFDSKLYASETYSTDKGETELEHLNNAPAAHLDKFLKSVKNRTNRQNLSKEQMGERYAIDNKDNFLADLHREERPAGAEGTNELNLAYIYMEQTGEALYNDNKLTARDIRRFDNFQAHVQKLAKNPLFLNCARAHFNDTVRDWNIIENKADAKKEQVTDEYNKMLKEYGTFARYFSHTVGPMKMAKKEYTEQEMAELMKDASDTIKESVKKVNDLYISPKQRKQMYEKLVKVTVMQLLSEDSPTAERILQSAAADELAHERNPELKGDKTMKQLTKLAFNYYVDKKILEKGNLTDVLKKLDNGTLTREFKNHAENHFKQELAREQAQNRPGIQVANPEEHAPVQNGPGLGMN